MTEQARIADALPFELVPLSPSIGAEIEGVDLSKPVAAETLKGLRAALLDRKVLFFTTSTDAQGREVSTTRSGRHRSRESAR